MRNRIQKRREQKNNNNKGSSCQKGECSLHVFNSERLIEVVHHSERRRAKSEKKRRKKKEKKEKKRRKEKKKEKKRKKKKKKRKEKKGSPMNVVLTVVGKIVVDDEGDLLDVNAAGQEIGGDEDTGGAGAELAHDEVPALLVHVAVHGGDGEVAALHLLGEPVDLAASVAEDDGLGDGEGLVEVAKGVELPVLALDRDVKLLDTLKGELVALDEDTDGVAHELLGDLEDLNGHGGGEEDDLDTGGDELEDLVDLVLEAPGEHLVGLVEDEHLDIVGLEGLAAGHVVDAAGGADDNVDAGLELAHVLADVDTADGGVALDAEVVTEGDHDLLDLLGELTGGGEDKGLGLPEGGVQLLEDGDGKSSGLPGTRLGLGNHVVPLDDGDDGALLDGRGLLKTVGIDTPQEILLEAHLVKALSDLVPVGLDLLSGDLIGNNSTR